MLLKMERKTEQKIRLSADLKNKFQGGTKDEKKKYFINFALHDFDD